LFGDNLFELPSFAPQLCDFTVIGLADDVAGQALRVEVIDG